MNQGNVFVLVVSVTHTHNGWMDGDSIRVHEEATYCDIIYKARTQV